MLENLKEVLSEEQVQELQGFIESEKAKATEGLITDEQLQKSIQSETDKVRTEYSKKVKVLEEELQGLKPMQKTEQEIELENKLKEMQDKERELQQKERYFKTVEVLEQHNIPPTLAKFINIDIDNAEEIENFKNTFNQTLMSSGYKPSGHKSNEGITKEDFAGMSYSERLELFKTNPDLFNKLSK